MVIFNEGTIGDPERNGLINGTVEGYGVRSRRSRRPTPPAATWSTTRRTARCRSTPHDRLPTRNVIAETTTGRTDRTVVSGAHLDSVPEGPGINDDGSGIATQLELALQMAKLGIKPPTRPTSSGSPVRSRACSARPTTPAS